MTKRAAVIAVLVSFAALAIALVLGGGAPTKAAAGLPDAGLTIGWLVPLLAMASLLTEFALVGFSLAAVVFFVDEEGALGSGAMNFMRKVPAITLLWIAINLFLLPVRAAYEIGIPFRQVLNFATIDSYATQTIQGNSILWQFLFIAILMGVSALTHRVRGAVATLVLSLLVFIPIAIHSHASGAGHHSLATGVITVHIIASALWVSGVIALVAMRKSKLSLAIAVPRFSVLALWCVIALGLTGVVSGWIRVGSIPGFASKYGAIMLAKAIALGLLIVIGARHRRAIRARVLDGEIGAFIRLISVELITMFAAVGLAVALAQTPPPIARVPIAYAGAEQIVGSPMPPPPTLSNLLLRFDLDGFSIAFIVVAAALYFFGVRKLSRRGDHWPVGRSVAFVLGLAVFGYSTSGGLGDYALFAFSFHMIAHMAIVALAPIGIVLGAPITLALRALPAGTHPGERGARGILNAAVHSKVSQFYSHPVVALIVFDGSLFALYLTPIFGKLMRSHIGHVVMDFHFLAAGILFFYLIIGVDPSPRRVPHLVRIVLLFAAMSIHAFFSIAVMSTTALLDGGYFASLNRPWWTDLLNDQHTGGAVGWSMGEVPIAIALVALFIQWSKDDAREAKRLDRASDRAVAKGQDDELAKYNAQLAALTKRDGNRNG